LKSGYFFQPGFDTSGIFIHYSPMTQIPVIEVLGCEAVLSLLADAARERQKRLDRKKEKSTGQATLEPFDPAWPDREANRRARETLRSWMRKKRVSGPWVLALWRHCEARGVDISPSDFEAAPLSKKARRRAKGKPTSC
jgi:hypothetical protein